MRRSEILKEAEKCVCGQREHDYGKPEDCFALIGKLWEAYTGTKFTAKDVAIMLALLKVARIKAGDKADSFVDLAGYAACAGEIATSKKDGIISADTSGIHIPGHCGTWHTIDHRVIGGYKFYLMESDIYGDDAACILLDEHGRIVAEDLFDGFDSPGIFDQVTAR